MHKSDCPWDESTFRYGAKGGSICALNFLRHGLDSFCPWDKSSCLMAVRESNLEALKWLRLDNNPPCPWDKKKCIALNRSTLRGKRLQNSIFDEVQLKCLSGYVKPRDISDHLPRILDRWTPRHVAGVRSGPRTLRASFHGRRSMESPVENLTRRFLRTMLRWTQNNNITKGDPASRRLRLLLGRDDLISGPYEGNVSHNETASFHRLLERMWLLSLNFDQQIWQFRWVFLSWSEGLLASLIVQPSTLRHPAQSRISGDLRHLDCL